jgi:hypothetical protein
MVCVEGGGAEAKRWMGRSSTQYNGGGVRIVQVGRKGCGVQNVQRACLWGRRVCV